MLVQHIVGSTDCGVRSGCLYLLLVVCPNPRYLFLVWKMETEIIRSSEASRDKGWRAPRQGLACGIYCCRH